MDELTTDAASPNGSTLYLEIQQFYARQMHFLDDGHVEDWARTFTDDGVFEVDGNAVRGATDIVLAARRTTDQFAADGITRRHWIGMLNVTRDTDECSARSYALVLEIPRGGEAVIRRSTVCTDTLVREGDAWRVRYRRVSRDGLE
ncbi:MULTISPECIES: nuclear transport factor 2 family protein [Streptomyces]|uniref:nuclear transport factor 2 family protein n=1 Tax=Streptomyces TaxID=1883 RepID=UPI001FD3C55A|nr:nuclear transport factor 2 family protein [Streptomyces kasugaensis]